MRYRVLINLSRDKWFTPSVDHPFVQTYEGEVGTNGSRPTLEACAWHLVMLHNQDSRPDGQSGPSFSAGDVLVIESGTGVYAWQDHNGTELVECTVPEDVITDRPWIEVVKEISG